MVEGFFCRKSALVRFSLSRTCGVKIDHPFFYPFRINCVFLRLLYDEMKPSAVTVHLFIGNKTTVKNRNQTQPNCCLPVRESPCSPSFRDGKQIPFPPFLSPSPLQKPVDLHIESRFFNKSQLVLFQSLYIRGPTALSYGNEGQLPPRSA